MIDIHNHIIPGIDDGATNLDMSLRLLEQAIEQGITHIVCTPHMHPGRFDNDRQSIEPAFMDLKSEVAKRALPVKLAMAAEVRISDELMVQLKMKQVPFLGQWQGRPAVLLEMPHGQVPFGVENLLSWLLRQDIQPIIAHPERNKEIMRSPDRAQELSDRGALFQLTAGSVTGDFGEPARQTSSWLLDSKLVSFVASDAHHPERRAPAMAAAREVLLQSFGEPLTLSLTETNPMSLTRALFGDAL
ncbi:MAG: tyrosine-protein phosphatase [Endozoicomonas sp.]